jgi:competence protein ComEC
MPIPESDRLHIYVLNVGQADTQIVRTPQGKIVVIDAVKPAKVKAFLRGLGLTDDEPIDHLIITHPHADHYGGAEGLINTFGARSVSLSPFWHDHGWGSNGYRVLVNRLESDGIPVQFVSGYQRIYPDDLIDLVPQDGNADDQGIPRETVPFIEVLGPPNSLIQSIAGKSAFDTNHLSLMARVTWDRFSMVFAGDAQMENWAAFDREGMLESSCKVLSTAHHGSMNGTQWERLQILSPRVVIVSSDPDGRHDIPDVVGCAIFREYATKEDRAVVCLTSDTGTIEIRARSSGTHTQQQFREDAGDDVDLSQGQSLTATSNPTDWDDQLRRKLDP